MSNTTKPKLVIAEMVSRNTFLAFLVSVVIFMVTNLGMLDQVSERVILGFPEHIWLYILKVLGYSCLTALTILFGISHPGITKLIEGIQNALRDGKITPEEKLGLIMLAKDEFLGAWADLANMVAKKKENEIKAPDKIIIEPAKKEG